MPPRQLSGCAQVSGGCRNIVSLSRTRSDFSMRKRLERLEAARQAQVCDQCAFVVKLPDDFIGDRHLVLTSSAGDGWLWFEERPGPGPNLGALGTFKSVVELSADEANF